MGTGNFSPGVKRAVREADHSPPTSAEVKNMWIYTSNLRTPSSRSAELVKHSDNFISPFSLRNATHRKPGAVWTPRNVVEINGYLTMPTYW
jgi:hypothetical protein